MLQELSGRAELVHMVCSHELFRFGQINFLYFDTNLEENFTIYNIDEICSIALDITNITD